MNGRSLRQMIAGRREGLLHVRGLHMRIKVVLGAPRFDRDERNRIDDGREEIVGGTPRFSAGRFDQRGQRISDQLLRAGLRREKPHPHQHTKTSFPPPPPPTHPTFSGPAFPFSPATPCRSAISQPRLSAGHSASKLRQPTSPRPAI